MYRQPVISAEEILKVLGDVRDSCSSTIKSGLEMHSPEALKVLGDQRQAVTGGGPKQFCPAHLQN